MTGDTAANPWMEVSCPNGLDHVYKLHCGDDGVDIDKTVRNVFVTGTMSDVRRRFQVTC